MVREALRPLSWHDHDDGTIANSSPTKLSSHVHGITLAIGRKATPPEGAILSNSWSDELISQTRAAIDDLLLRA